MFLYNHCTVDTLVWIPAVRLTSSQDLGKVHNLWDAMFLHAAAQGSHRFLERSDSDVGNFHSIAEALLGSSKLLVTQFPNNLDFAILCNGAVVSPDGTRSCDVSSQDDN